jgi:hypothetical protein
MKTAALILHGFCEDTERAARRSKKWKARFTAIICGDDV